MTEFAHASALEGVRFTTRVGLPNVVQGLFKKREIVARAASVVQAERIGFSLVSGLVAKYGPDPFFVRVAKDEALLVSAPADLEFVLGGSPDPFAADPPTKKAGMTAFQPDALTLSRADTWADRRAFADAVLEPGSHVHHMASAFLPLAVDAADGLSEEFDAGDVNIAFQRLTRQVIFGSTAADDTALTDLLGSLMNEANKGPGKPGDRYPELLRHIDAYVQRADPGSLASLFAAAAPEGVDPAGQVIHWMFAMGDTLAANVSRCLALLATHPDQWREATAALADVDLTDPASLAGAEYLAGCLQEAMRLYPTTALFGRVTTRDVTFPNGATLPEGTQVLIHNLFNHRDRSRFDYADRFAPEEWTVGDAAKQWSFNFFSHGPQVCPGAPLALFLGSAFVARLLTGGALTVRGWSGRPGKPLPYGMDLSGLTFGRA